jgi:hypothetical protein
LSFALPTSGRDDRVNVDGWWHVSAFFFGSFICGQWDSEHINGAKDEGDFSPWLALFNFDDPLAADPDLVSKGLLVEPERDAAIAYEGSKVN